MSQDEIDYDQKREDSILLARKEVARFNLVEHKGVLHISVSHCVHCNFIVFGAKTDDCTNPECDGEIYGVSKLFPMGLALDRNTLDQTS